MKSFQQPDWNIIVDKARAAFMGVALGDEELLCRYAVAQAHITHNNPLSDAACIFFGRLVHRAIMGATLNELRILADGFVAEYLLFGFSPYPGNSSAYVVDTVQTVFHYLFSTTSFEECLIGIVNQGGGIPTPQEPLPVWLQGLFMVWMGYRNGG